MPKIFGIGLGKTGTTSLARALEALGYKTLHFPKSIDQARKFDAMLDNPVGLWYKELDRLYPGSRFIYTARELNAWLESCRKWFSPTPIAYRWHRLAVRKDLFGTTRFDAQRFAEVYQKHEEDVTRYFKDRQADLLVLRICEAPSSNLWSQLIAFLNPPFPAENVSASRRWPWSTRGDR